MRSADATAGDAARKAKAVHPAVAIRSTYHRRHGWSMMGGPGPDGARATPPAIAGTGRIDRRARLGALALLTAILVFAVTVAVALGTAGTTYDWRVNMLSDLGHSQCRSAAGRWICSPGFALFNAGLVVTGLLLSGGGLALGRVWGRVLAASLVVMGLGLVLAGVFPAGDHDGVHLGGVVLALVLPGMGLLLSAIRPEASWLVSHRLPRGVLGAVALVFCAESRLPIGLLPRGAGEVIIVGCLLLAIVLEAARLLAARPAQPGWAG